MNFTTIPEPGVVLAELEPLVSHLYTALETGTMRAREYFDQDEKPINRYLAPEIVRYHAKIYLDSVAEGLFKTEPLARNGLWIREFNNLEIRVLKSFDGELPVPGSKAKQEYYEQMTFAVFEPSHPLKLVVLWNVSYPYNLTPLTLAVPRTSDPEHMMVEAHWYAPIPYPVPASFEDTKDASNDSVDKMIKPKKKPETGTDDDSNK